MYYYKITTSTIYCGTENEHYIASQEPMSEAELNDLAEELKQDNADSFEYLVRGWDDELVEDMSEDEIDELMTNYYADCSCEWEEISKEEYEENMGA